MECGFTQELATCAIQWREKYSAKNFFVPSPTETICRFPILTTEM